MGVSVMVKRQGQSLYMDHFVESKLRSELDEGQLSEGQQLLQLPSGVVYFSCIEPPDCTERIYQWLSGDDTYVEIGNTCAYLVTRPSGGSSAVYPPCPEPTEILEAYLTRYPSSLTYYVDSDSQARRWWARRAELQMAAAKYELDRSETGGQAPSRLNNFARIRGDYLDGPAFGPQMSRIEAVKKLPAEAKKEQLTAIWDEYHVWWVANQGAPVELYVAPTPTPVTTPATPDPTP